MATTLMQLRRLVRSRMGLPLDDDFMQDNVLDDHINLALQTLDGEARWPWDEISELVNVTPAAPFIPLPVGWRATRAVFYKELELGLVAPADTMRFGETTSDIPVVFCPIGGTIVIRPIPNVPIDVVHYFYGQEPWLSADDGVPLLPSEYTGAVVAKAAELLSARESSGGDATRHGAEYTQWVTRMRRDMRRSTSPIRVRVRPGSWV